MPSKRAGKLAGAVRCLAGLAALAQALCGQPATPAGLTVGRAVEEALRNYPSIRVTQEQMTAAAAGIRLAQTAYLPRVDGLAQINRATRNTFYGLLLPQGVIPGVDGVAANNLGSVWDSAVGVLVTWQPFDFGLRAAHVAGAAALHSQTEAAVNRTRYDVSVATADAFLTVMAAQQTAEAARAAVDSWQVLLRSVHALVAAQLRPGADESRVQAELAVAETQVAEAEQAIDVARSTVAQFVGREPSQLNLNPGKLVAQLPPERPVPSLEAAANPLAREQNAGVAVAEAQLKELERTYYPQFLVQGVAAARGTGMLNDGGRLGGLNGLAPTTQNYGVGLTVLFPAMDRFAIREEEAMQAAHVRAGQAQYQVIATNLQAQFHAAQARLTGARRVAANTPVEVSAARTALEQATARYRAGLATSMTWRRRNGCWSRHKSTTPWPAWTSGAACCRWPRRAGDIQPFLAEAGQ